MMQSDKKEIRTKITITTIAISRDIPESRYECVALSNIPSRLIDAFRTDAEGRALDWSDTGIVNMDARDLNYMVVGRKSDIWSDFKRKSH